MQINESIGTARKYLQGKKTIFCCVTGSLYVLGVWLGFWDWDERVLAMFGLGGLAFLRVAIGAKTGTDQHGQARTGTDAPASGPRTNLLLMLPLMLALAAGCTAPRDVAGKTLVTTVQSVDAAMQGWGAWVRAGQASAQDEAKVKAFYERYQMAELAAEKAYAAWHGAGPHGATGEQSAWTAAAAALRASQKDLLGLIEGLQTAKK